MLSILAFAWTNFATADVLAPADKTAQAPTRSAEAKVNPDLAKHLANADKAIYTGEEALFKLVSATDKLAASPKLNVPVTEASNKLAVSAQKGLFDFFDPVSHVRDRVNEVINAITGKPNSANRIIPVPTAVHQIISTVTATAGQSAIKDSKLNLGGDKRRRIAKPDHDEDVLTTGKLPRKPGSVLGKPNRDDFRLKPVRVIEKPRHGIPMPKPGHILPKPIKVPGLGKPFPVIKPSVLPKPGLINPISIIAKPIAKPGIGFPMPGKPMPKPGNMIPMPKPGKLIPPVIKPGNAIPMPKPGKLIPTPTKPGKVIDKVVSVFKKLF